MKTLKWIGLVALIGLAGGCGPGAAPEPKQETALETKVRLRSDADAMMGKACSNYVTGIDRIVELRVSDLSENANDWTAEAIVEFKNRAGGIERTNLPLKFSTWGDIHGARQLSVIVDEHKIAAREQAAFEREVERFSQGRR